MAREKAEKQRRKPRVGAPKKGGISNPFRKAEGQLSPKMLRGYTVVKKLGKGSFGVVYEALKPGNKPIALKLVDLKETSKTDFVFEREMAQLCSEEKLGPQYYESWNMESSKIGALVLELWDQTLGSWMDKSGRTTVPKVVVDKVQWQLDKLHQLNLHHLDLHADNILVRLNQKGDVIDATLSDFGKTTHETDIDMENLEKIVDFYELPKGTTIQNIDQRMFSQIKQDWK